MNRQVAHAARPGGDLPAFALADDDRVAGDELSFVPVDGDGGGSVDDGDENIPFGVGVLGRTATGIPGEQGRVQIL